MDKNSAIKLIDTTFSSAFDEAQFTNFIQNLLNDLEIKPYQASGNTIWDDQKEHVSYYKRIGKYIDPEGEALDVLIVQVKNLSKLDRARTALRNFVIKHLNNFEKDYALVAFYSKEDKGADWRFSFIKMEHQSYIDEEKQKVKIKKEFTPAKRYSFLVGEHEKSHTAKSQLLPLLQSITNNPTIAEIEQAFSIEKVTNEFFEQYKGLYIKVYEYFEKQNLSIFKDEQLDASGFTKKLLGQIVFLYFLQKKGWLGVPKDKKWGEGDKHFVQNLFDKAQKENENFFKDYLQYLFYEALAKERDNVNSFYSRFNCRIPFLNGGLFEAQYDWRNANVSIPTELFRNEEKNKSGDVGTGILDVFDRYNFTIKEDEPLDKEVAVDPEMLGKVFENMLEIKERKSKGAFYTPREIVHYMCQESLIHYLDNALNHENQKVSKENIEEYIREGHLALENDIRVAERGETKTYKFQLPESIREYADIIDKKLTEIRICDPAIGSGAFPVGLLHELVNAQLILKPHLSNTYLDSKLKSFELRKQEINEQRYIYRLKKHIIQESIYGVDIDRSAIDIARLRLWLSLVVDEDNLDPIETLPNLDYKIVAGNSLIGMGDVAMRDLNIEKELENLKDEFYATTDEKCKKNLRDKINAKIKELLDTAGTFTGYEIDFDFKLYFSEVFREKGGFDIIIGNPPYIQLQKEGGKLAKMYADCNYQTFAKTGDIYSLFYERGWQLLKEHGLLCFITSNKWMRAGYGKSTRNFFVEKTNPLMLIDFAGQKIFDSATVDTNILLYAKENNTFKTKACIVKEKVLKNLSDYFMQNATDCNFSNDESWVILSEIEQRIKAKIEAVGTPLKDWDINIYRGILTGYNEAFIIDGEKRKELIKQDPKSDEIIRPLLRGRDIKRYSYEFANLYLICTFPSLNLDIEKYPAVKEYLMSFGRERLEQTGKTHIINGKKIKSRKKTNNKWFETQDSIGYWEDFNSQVLPWQRITAQNQFCVTKPGTVILDSMAFLSNVGDYTSLLLAVLNSKLIYFWIKKTVHEYGNTGFRLSNQYVEMITIPQLTKEERKPFEQIVEEILNLHNQSISTKKIEKEIDKMVYKLYNLTEEEIEFIELE